MFTCRETRVIHEEENLFLLFYLQLHCIDSYIGIGTYTSLHFIYTYIGIFLVAQMDTGLQGNQNGSENVSTAKIFQDSGRETELTVDLAVDDMKFSKAPLFLPLPGSHRAQRKEKRRRKKGSPKPMTPMLTLARRRRRNSRNK